MSVVKVVTEVAAVTVVTEVKGLMKKKNHNEKIGREIFMTKKCVMKTFDGMLFGLKTN